MGNQFRGNQKIYCLSFEEMQRYVSNEFKPDEKNKLHYHVKFCTFCQASIRSLKNHTEPEKVDSELKIVRNTVHQEIQRLKRRQYKRWGSLAAAAVVFMGILPFLFQFTTSSPNQQLFREHFEMYPNTLDITRNIDTGSIFSHAMANYGAGKYEIAAAQLNDLLSVSPDSHMAHFYLGNIRLKTNQPKVAIDHLNAAANSEDLSDRATWYLGLAYLQMGKLDKAQSIFNELANSTNEYQNNSIKIIDELLQISTK